MTSRQTFTRLTAALPLAAAAMTVAAWGAYTAASDVTARWDVGTDEEVMAIRPHAPGSPAALLARHADDCWTGSQAPKADLPGSALVQDTTGHTRRAHAHAVVDSAFREALSSVGLAPAYDDPQITVVALCR